MKTSTLALIALGLYLWQRHRPAMMPAMMLHSEAGGIDPRVAFMAGRAPTGAAVRYADNPLAGLVGVPNLNAMTASWPAPNTYEA